MCPRLGTDAERSFSQAHVDPECSNSGVPKPALALFLVQLCCSSSRHRPDRWVAVVQDEAARTPLVVMMNSRL